MIITSPHERALELRAVRRYDTSIDRLRKAFTHASEQTYHLFLVRILTNGRIA